VGLFDNLFKTKPEAADEAVVEAAKRISETEKARLVEANKAVPVTPAARPPGVVPTAKPGSVPAPRDFIVHRTIRAPGPVAAIIRALAASSMFTTATPSSGSIANSTALAAAYVSIVP